MVYTSPSVGRTNLLLYSDLVVVNVSCPLTEDNEWDGCVGWGGGGGVGKLGEYYI